MSICLSVLELYSGQDFGHHCLAAVKQCDTSGFLPVAGGGGNVFQKRIFFSLVKTINH